MSALLHLTEIPPASASFKDLDTASQTFQPSLAVGATQRNVPSAPPLQTVRLRYSRAGRVQLFRMQAFYKSLRGRANDCYLWPFGRSIQGAFSAPELLTNAEFSNGTTGWTANNGTLSASNRALRITRTSNGANPFITQSPTAIQYSMLVARAVPLSATPLELISSSVGIGVAANYSDGYGSGDPYANTIARRVRTTIAESAAGTFYLDNNVTGGIAGGYHEWSWASLARCLVVDNGPNALLQSQTLGTTWTPSTNSTIIDNQGTAPDGTVTAEHLREGNTANIEHYVFQTMTVPAAAADFSFTVTVANVTRNFAAVRMIENTGGTGVYVFVNLTTGAIGTTSAGANWANARAFVVSQGNGLWRITIVARKTNAATSIGCYVSSATADNNFFYAGVAAQNAISIWGGSFAQSSVPVRYVATTTTATTGTPQTGSALYVKGGRTPSEGALSGALLQGDFVEIITANGSELNAAAANLDLDAAGNGYLQLVNPIRNSPADGAAIIVNRPMGKFMLTADVDIPELVTGMGEFEATFQELWT